MGVASLKTGHPALEVIRSFRWAVLGKSVRRPDRYCSVSPDSVSPGDADDMKVVSLSVRSSCLPVCQPLHLVDSGRELRPACEIVYYLMLWPALALARATPFLCM